jgi:hypothetical protein
LGAILKPQLISSKETAFAATQRRFVKLRALKAKDLTVDAKRVFGSAPSGRADAFECPGPLRGISRVALNGLPATSARRGGVLEQPTRSGASSADCEAGSLGAENSR